MMNRYLFVLNLIIIISACSNEKTNPIEQVVEDFYQVYNQREDHERFMHFYDEKVVLEDIINGDRITGKTALSNFFDWRNPDFKKLDTNNLRISEKIIDGNKAVVKGAFSRFQWGETEFEAMHFTTILHFNESKKIIKQVDWINYPASLVNYNERKNANEWIK